MGASMGKVLGINANGPVFGNYPGGGDRMDTPALEKLV
jgi:hypothetical protein